MSEIKPVAWAMRKENGRLDFNGCDLEPTKADRDSDEAAGFEYVELYTRATIDALQAEVERLRSAMTRVLAWVEPIAGDNRDEKAEAEELASIEQAKAAMQGDA